MSTAQESRDTRRVQLVSSPQSPPYYQTQPRREDAHTRAQQLLIHFQHQKEIFITKVYLVAGTLIALTLFQWLVLKADRHLSQDVEHYLKRHVFVSNLAAILGMLILSVFLFNRGLRFNQPFNTILALLIVELFTIGFLDIVLASEVESLVVFIFLTMTVYIALTVLAISVPRDLSDDIAAISVLSLLFLVFTAVYLLLVLKLSLYFPTAILTSCMLILMTFYIMYFSQIVFGTGGQVLRWKDHVFASLVIYFNYIVFLCTALVLEESLAAYRFIGKI